MNAQSVIYNLKFIIRKNNCGCKGELSWTYKRICLYFYTYKVNNTKQCTLSCNINLVDHKCFDVLTK